MTPSEEIIGRYVKIERQADSLGRLIGVRRLKPSQQTRIEEMTPQLDGETKMQVLDEETGIEKTVGVPRRIQITIAAAVCEIDSVPIPFARTRSELDAIFDRLDQEGIKAAMIAYGKLFPKGDDGMPKGGSEGDAKK